MGGLENACFGLLSLVETARKRLGQIPGLEDASKWDFDLTLFFDFFESDSCSAPDFKPCF